MFLLVKVAVAYFIRMLLSLRYRIEVVGLDQIEGKKGALFLPNHPAQLDPVMLATLLWPKFSVRPVVVEYFYEMKGVSFLMKLVRALPVPELGLRVNKYRRTRMEKADLALTEGLKAGDNFLLYPAGRLKRTGEELIGGASLVHSLLERHPEAQVVLVRTTGLWGSQFSRALTGRAPSVGGMLAQGMKILLKNGIFFAPRRKVKIEFVSEPADFPRGHSRLACNQYLERWYNAYPKKGAEPLSLVSYAFWKQELPEVSAEKKKKARVNRTVPPAISQVVFAKLAELAKVDPAKIAPSQHLSFDLGLDSLDVAQVYAFLDEQYHVAELLPGELQTVSDVLQSAVGNTDPDGRPIERDRKIAQWPKEVGRKDPIPPLGETIPEALFLMARRMGNNGCCIDRMSGLVSYRRLLLGAFLLAKKIQKREGEYVAILLPAAIGSYVAILATLLAGKIPVMLNWTAGVRSLDHAMGVTGFSTVLTSGKFLDNLEDGDLGKVEELFCLLEDLKKEITFWDKLRALFFLRLSPKKQQKTLGLTGLSAERPAVVLFTSGTEALPKAVPLSHRNLLENHRSGLKLVDFFASDIMYSVLPPFHSFGFSVTGLLPILAGFRVCFSPDPTDSAQMARDIAYWKATVFCSAPSFIRSLFRVATKEELSSLRIILTGAEKAPEEIFTYFASLGEGKEMLEGYGITECSPMVALTRPGQPRVGVGLPIVDVELCAIDEKDLPLGEGVVGEICVCGPNVFAGYLKESRNPFVQIEGKLWYRTGDRGFIDENGAITLVGRIKRFVKVGGEMVSLMAIEEALQQKFRREDEASSIAVVARETGEEKSAIYLFATVPISKEEVNILLREEGHGRIVKIAGVIPIAQIPLTGTGKTDYRRLEEMIGT